MLLRMTLAIDDDTLMRRLSKLLNELDVHIQQVSEDQLNWESLPPFPTDILIVSKSLITTPIEKHINVFTASSSAASVIVIFSDETDEAHHASLRSAGAVASLFSGLADQDLREAISTIIDNKRKVLNRLIVARRASVRPQLSDFISRSGSMQMFLKVVKKVVDSSSNLLIAGETGVGKERLARAIHSASRRGNGPFVSVNCGAIPENLIESELFGHMKGSFTGAQSNKRGCFELAHNGILFLDEISELPLNLQVKLLHVLQDFNIRPIGSEKVIPVDTRVIAATNRNLQSEMDGNRFRRDLYYRLSILTLTVPPLRERTEDIPELAKAFVGELSNRIGSDVDAISDAALDALCRYKWPGNVRELINVIERSILLSETRAIELINLPEEISGFLVSGKDSQDDGVRVMFAEDMLRLPLQEAKQRVVEEYEREHLRELLKIARGRIGETARLAGITPRSLFGKMRSYGLRKEDFKNNL